MTGQKFFSTEHINLKSLAIRMLIGGLIGLMIISVFVFSVGNPNPEWGKFWRIRPLIITPLAGAMGGLLVYSVNFFNFQNKPTKVIAVIFSLIGFVVALWLGIVLGLDGTLWD